MPAANVTISGQVTGLPTGSKQLGPFLLTNLSSGGAVTELTSLNGANTITVPGTAYIGCIIEPPAGNTGAITLKGVAGDTGFPLHLTQPSVLTFPAGTASFVLNIVGAGLAFEISWF